MAALPALALARLLPEHGAGLYLRLAAATLVLLLPGILIARALGQRGASAALLWALGALFVALAATFVLSGTLVLTLALLAVAAVVAFVIPFGRARVVGAAAGGAWWLVLGGGILFGLALWHVAGHIGGDGIFHLARIRKLVEFENLSTGAVNEFADGSLHPGYAFPLWHSFLGLVSTLAGVDPGSVVLYEASVLVPLAFLVVYEAGVALFGSAWLGGAVLAGQVALVSLAAGHGGSFVPLALPATASRQLLVPAVLALVFVYARARARRVLLTLAAGGAVLTAIHPTYSLFLAVPLAGFLVVRTLFDWSDARRLGAALGAFLLPTGGVLLWLLPVVRETASHTPSEREVERALAQYAGQLDVASESVYRVAPELLSRGGAVAVAALAAIPLAALAGRRRWSAFVLGGSLAVVAVVLVPDLFTRLSDAVSLSQSRRAAGFVPFAFAFAGGAAVLARLVGLAALPLALTAGIALQLAFPGDFTPRLEGDGGPAVVTWFALVFGGAALAAAIVMRSGRGAERRRATAGLAALLFVLPVAVHAAGNWSPSEARRPSPLTTGLVEALRERVPEGAIVFSDLETSYRIGAAAPLYVAAGPPAHVADTEANRPYERRRDVRRFLRTGDLTIPRRYGADWLVVDKARFDVRPQLAPVYADGRYTLYRL